MTKNLLILILAAVMLSGCNTYKMKCTDGTAYEYSGMNEHVSLTCPLTQKND